MGDHLLQTVGKTDISHDWYMIDRDPDQQYLTIDLNPQRVGRCYDGFIGRHAVALECQIIATTFADLLTRLVNNQGDYPYWLQDTFEPLGLAYDE